MSTSFHLSSRPKPQWTCLLNMGGSFPRAGDRDWDVRLGETTKLGVAEWSDRDGLVYVPGSYHPSKCSPVLMALHSETSSAEEALSALIPFAEEHRLLLTAPESRGSTWSTTTGMLNEDVSFIDKALESLFENYSVQDDRVCVAGFSTGASFALDLGVRNGDLFSHVMAFSPAEAEPPCYEDGPAIFVSYERNRDGQEEQWSKRVIPRLRSCGYNCRVHEYSPSTHHGRHPPTTQEVHEYSPYTHHEHHHDHYDLPSSQGHPSRQTLEEQQQGSTGQLLVPKDVVASAVDWFAKGSDGPCFPNFEYMDSPPVGKRRI